MCWSRTAEVSVRVPTMCHPRLPKPIHGKAPKCPKDIVARGANDTKVWCQWTHAWQPPTPVSYATHFQQPACNPQTTLTQKTIKKYPKTHPKGYQNGGSQPEGLASQLSPILPKSTLAGADIYQKCSRNGSGILGSSQNGSGHTCCHHRWAGFIWTHFPLVYVACINFVQI